MWDALCMMILFLVCIVNALVQLTWSCNTRYHMDAYTTFFIGAVETLGQLGHLPLDGNVEIDHWFERNP